MRANIRMWFGRLDLQRLKAALVLLGSALFLASSFGGCETVSDPLPVVEVDHTPERSTSPFTSQWDYSAAQLSDGATSLTWAPDGEHILFSSGGLLGVYVVDSAGLELRPIPETAPLYGGWERPGAFAPSLSPDGARVAYSVFVPRDSSVIETAAFDGSDIQRLTPIEFSENPNDQHSVYPVWSPDGQQIAFVSNRAVSDEYYGDGLFVMDADGSNMRAVAPSVRVECHDTWQGARWSPDGNWLAFTGSEPRVEGRERIGLYSVRLDGSEPTRIDDLYTHYCSPASWSPDSSRFAYMGREDFAYGQELPFFYIAEADGSKLVQLVSTSWDWWSGSGVPPVPAWSPDGAWLAFTGFQRTSSDSIGPTVYVVRPDGSDLRNLTAEHQGTGYGSVVWSPDGEEVWFNSGSGAFNFMVRPDGSGLREVIARGIPGVVETAWSPDGLLLAVLSVSEDGRIQLYTILRDGTIKRLVRGSAEQLVAEHSDWTDTSADIAACADIYSGNPGLVRDCQTLLRLRDRLAGQALLNWKASIPIQQWQGIFVEGSPPRVRGLHFGDSESNALTGVIPPEIGSLSELVELRLNWQRLTGEIPSELGNLKSLKWLDLRSNSLSGPIPSEIGDLTELTTLNLRDNELSGRIPKSLGRLAKLGGLDLSQNPLEGSIPAELGNLKQLRRLRVCCTNLEGNIPPEIGGLTNLRVLDLKFNYLTGTVPPELGNLENLVNLYLYANYFSGCVPAVLSERLQDFDLRGLDFCE